MEYGERKTLIGVVLIFIMFLMSLFYVVEEVQAYSKPSTSNGDAYLRSSGSINNDIYRVSYLYDSLFTGDVYKNPYIHKAERDGGYTCWAYNAKDYDFYAETTLRHPFGGSAGKGNESYGETLNLRQCEDGEKLIEYEIHASDNISNSSYNPSMSYSTVSGKKANYLRFTGWATLGGFTHHSGWNQSTYVVAIEQKNGKNTTSTSGVHITKAVANETNLTNFLQYNGIPTCLGNSANGSYSYEQGAEFNRYRGLNFYTEHNSKYVVPGTTSVLSFYYNNITGASPNQGDGELLRHYRANERWYKLYWNPYERKSIKYSVHGLGCNFYYPYAGFAAYLNLDDMIGDGKSNKDFKIYLVKRVRDMVVATEMQMPKYTEKKSIKYGTVSFEGYGNADTVRPNRTALPPFRGYYSGSWLFHSRDWNYDGKDGYLDKSKDYKLKKVFIKEGHPSIYRIEDPDNGLPYYHYAHYFDYNQQNEGSTLKYRLAPKDVQVRHWDLLTCPNDVRGNISNLLETNIIPKGCNQVREKSTGGYAQKGDGLYSKNFYSQWFYTYQGAEVYRTSKTNDNFEDITPHRLVYLAGKGTAYVNFFYINRNEVGSLKVNYIDNQTGNKLQDSVVLNRLKKGETVSFPVPDRIIPNSGRYYYIMNSSQSSSIKITGDNVVNIKYNPNPNVTFEYIDRQTGTKLGEDTYLHQRGTNFSKTPPSSTSYSGKTYYREDSGAISYSSLWDDKVVKVYYTNDKQVEARHYDYYTCPSSVQAQRTGDLGNTSCVELREKSTGKIADKGSGTYETDKEYRFYPYSNADNNLYEDDKSGDKYTAVYPHSVVVNLQGKNKTHVNFFYINDKDLGNLRVKYVDYHTGKTLRTDYVQTRIKKGTTVSYDLPESIAGDDGRTYYLRSSYNGSVKITQDNHNITVKYNYNPNIYVKKIDRDTGKVLGTDKHHVNRGGTYNITPDSVVSSGGSNYYREDSGALTFSSVWKDTTKNVYYSKYKDVYVRHYDYYSCDLSEADNMLGPTGDVCTQLREKDTGKLATKGSGRYETDKAHRFYKYADADDNLYSSSRTQDSYYAENASSQVINLNGKSVTYINFFYKNRQDEAKLTVKYIDRQSGKTLRSTYTESNVEKGTVVNYPIPDTLLSNSRQYYKYSDYNGSIRLLEDTTLTVLYNYDPKIKTELVDRETGNIISTYGPFRRDRGADYDTRTNASTTRYFNGSNHYRIDDSVKVVSGESNSKLNGHILKDVWKDTTIRYYYSGVRDVKVIHYDEFSCDSNGNNCDQLKEKSSGKNARKGSGKYYQGKHDFVSYNTTENKLYNKSSSDNFFKVKDGGGYSNEETKNENITVSHSTVNNNTPYYVKFYYINKAESTKLTVEYRDKLTGKKLRNDHVENYIQKGKTVDYPTPVYINNSDITGSSRNYFPIDDYEGSVTMTDDKKIVLYYNYKPQLTVESVDRETGSNIRTTRYTLSAGGDFTVGGGAVALYNWGGTYHYRIDDTKEIISGGKDARWVGDSLDIENVWEDTTVRVLYTNMRDVIVNHYDTYSKVMEGKDKPLKMKSDGSIANKGSGLYEGAYSAHTSYSNARHTFSPYIDSGNKLYLRDRVNDRYRADSGSIEEFLTVNRTTVNNNTPFYVDFYYTNDEDISDVTVEYVDTKGNEIAPKKVFEDRFRNTTINRSEYFKGDVITYNGRPYELLEDNVGSSINVTGDDTTYTYVYVKRPQVTRQYIDRDTNKVIAQGKAYLKYNSSWNHKNPENITVGGKTYTSYEKPVYYTKKNIREDFTYKVEYTTEKLEKEPVEFAVKGGTTEGMTDIDDVSWTMDEEGITTKSELEISGVHADIEGAEVREFYTTTDNFDDAYTTTKDGKKTRFKHSEVLDKNSPKYTHTEDMHKKPYGSHHLEVEYKYTNVLKKDFKCDYGETEDWCFEWSEKSTDTRTPYWGERDPNEKVEAELPNGKVEDVPVYNEYLLEMELDNNSDVGKDVTVTNSKPLNEKLEIGREFVGSDDTVGEEKVTKGSFKGDVSEIKSYYEELEMTPKLDFENDTQSGIKFKDSIGYANDYGTKFEETEYVGYYLVKLDKNLANKLPEEDGLSKVGVIYDKDTEEFRFDKVFGITQKYGIQVMADYEEYKENPNVLETKMHEELELLELGNDEIVELDYTESRYFLPIDDATDVKSNNIEDGVELDELGVTDINVKYVKGIEYDDYLYGNVFDDPIYAAQKEETKKVVYENSETLDNDKLKEIEKYLDENEREDRVNLYRITDDEDIKDLLSE